MPRPCLRALTAAVAKREGGHAGESRARPAEEIGEDEEQGASPLSLLLSRLPLLPAATNEAATAASSSEAQQAPPPTAAAVAHRSSVRG